MRERPIARKLFDQPFGLLPVGRAQVERQPVVRRLALRLRAGKGKEEAEVQLVVFLQQRQHPRHGGRADVVEEQEDPVLLHQLHGVLDRLIGLIPVVVGLEHDRAAVHAAGAVDLGDR